ncbi:MAG TPA: MFS transporter [Ktedonobacteraceae bacterium]|nr:MFS transporter [Ktedonobacteraceae bacterium]
MSSEHSSTTAGTLWQDRAFLLFWSGRTVTLLGSAITKVVLPILVYRLTGSALLTSLLTTLEVVPYFIFGLFAGTLADRVNRRWLMVSCDLLNAVLLGSIPLAGLLHILTIAQILVVTLLSAIAFVWFDAANFGALPTLVGRERIVAATSAIWTVSTVVDILGPAVGGALAAFIGPTQTLSADALSYLVSAVSLVLIPRALSNVRQVEGEERPIRQLIEGIGQGIGFIWRHRVVRALTLLGFGNSFTGGAVLGLLVVYTVQGLGIPVTDERIGLLFTAGGVGALLASLLLPQVTKRVPVGWITLIAMGLNLLCLLGLVVMPFFGLAFVLFTCWEMGYVFVTMNGIALRQLVTPEHLLSRVNTYARMIAWGGTPFGAAVGGLLAQWTPIRVTYLLVAVGVFLSIVIGWFSPLREHTMAQELVNPRGGNRF